ncbi:MAG: DUF4389 domain-containing protein [Candidatus Margulisiibacteriota bacterium]|jgi:hypothetical protein
MKKTQTTNLYPYAELVIPCPKKSNRLTAFFRLFCVIPILILFSLLMGTSASNGCVIGGGMLFLPIAIMILFRKKYPRIWFDWVYYLLKFETRVFSYLFLLRDEYPAVEEDQEIKLSLKYPDAAKELKRGMPLIKWFLAIPHYVILILLFLVVVIATFIAWISILFIGKYPPKIHQFVVGVFRWGLRVTAYAFLMVTDKYPPFRF